MGYVSVEIPRGNELSDEIKAQLLEDLATNPIRKLTNNERTIYSAAIVQAVQRIPAFRDALALLRPYMDATASTAYTDQHARVGLSYWFFYILDDTERMSVLLHECMHVLNNHFQRRSEIQTLKSRPEIFNIAADFEINTVLNNIRYVNLSEGLLPDRAPYNHPPYKSMEQYVELLAKDQQNAEDNCEACQQEKKDEKDKKEQQQQDSSDSSNDKSDSSDDANEDSESDDSSGDTSDNDGADDSDNSENGESSSSNGDSSDDSEGGDSGNSSSESNGASGNGGSPSHTCGKEHGQHGESSGEGSAPRNGVIDPNGKSWACGDASDATEAAADEAGIQRASDVEQTITKQNTAARIVDERNTQGRGLGHMDKFWDSILKHLTPPVVDWRKILRTVVASSVDSITKGRANYTYRRVSRRLQHREFVFPGMVDYQPKIMLAVDTSGSMGNEDYQKVLVEIEGIVKTASRGKDAVSLFSVDTEVGDISPVTSTKKIRFKGGGGTRMAVAWKFVKNLPKAKQPDVLILVTDGGIDWADVEHEVRNSKFKSIICVTQEYGYQYSPMSLRRYAPVLNLSDDKSSNAQEF